MENKKKNKKILTLTVSTKKPFSTPNYMHSRQKTSVVIEKKVSRKRGQSKFYGHSDTRKSFSKPERKSHENFTHKNKNIAP